MKARDDAKAMLNDSDPDLRSMAKEELDELNAKIAKAERDLTILMLPKDPNDQKNVMLEIRAGTGGEEAALFAGDLLRMYTRYASKAGWRTEVLSSTSAERGGIKEVIMLIWQRIFINNNRSSGCVFSLHYFNRYFAAWVTY
jgi:peptide chain release factor 1